jgi:hypothetical protein
VVQRRCLVARPGKRFPHTLCEVVSVHESSAAFTITPDGVNGVAWPGGMTESTAPKKKMTGGFDDPQRLS